MKTKSITDKKNIVLIVSAFLTYLFISKVLFENWDKIKDYIFNVVF